MPVERVGVDVDTNSRSKLGAKNQTRRKVNLSNEIGDIKEVNQLLRPDNRSCQWPYLLRQRHSLNSKRYVAHIKGYTTLKRLSAVQSFSTFPWFLRNIERKLPSINSSMNASPTVI